MFFLKQVTAKMDGELLAIYQSNTTSAYVNGYQVTPMATVSTNYSISQPLPFEMVMTFPVATVIVTIMEGRLWVQVSVATNGGQPIVPIMGGLCGGWDMLLASRNATSLAGPFSQDFMNDFAESCML